MGDDPVPRASEGHDYVRDFITIYLLKTTSVVKAIKQDLPDCNLDNYPRRTVKIEASDNLFQTSKEVKNFCLTDFIPYFLMSVQNMHGYCIDVSNSETLIAKDNKPSALKGRFEIGSTHHSVCKLKDAFYSFGRARVADYYVVAWWKHNIQNHNANLNVRAWQDFMCG